MHTMTDLPFNIDQKFEISRVLHERHEIPYHSRPFMWDRESYIEPVVKNSLQKYRQNTPHWLGFVIIYSNSRDIPAISDAQHRTTIYFLMNVCISVLLNKQAPLKSISQYGEDDDLSLMDITPTDADILQRYDWSRYPNIQSRYEYDFEALGNILNGKTRDSGSISKLYDAYDIILDVLRESLTTPEDIKGFWRFINNYTYISRMTISDWNFAFEVFTAMNNIKFTVPPVYLLKNEIVKRIGIHRSQEVHNTFQKWEEDCGSSFHQYVHYATDMIRRKITSLDEYSRDIVYVFEGDADPFILFQNTMNRILQIMEFIEQDRFGSILVRIANGNEMYHHCILPVFFFAPNMDVARPLLRKLVAFGIRWEKRVSFNPMKFQNALVKEKGIITQFLQGKYTFEEIMIRMSQQLQAWLGGDSVPVRDRILNESYKKDKFSLARSYLLYIVEVTDHHEAHIDHSKIDIDHIYPQKPKKNEQELLQKENIYRIGNFTPFVKGISDSGLRGNRSVQNMQYLDKITYYKSSNIAMTRRIADEYPDKFTDDEITMRTLAIAEQLDTLTALDVGLLR